MHLRLCFFALLLAAACRGEIIDRIAVTVGSRVVTTNDITREIRLSAFINQTKPDFSPQARKQTAGRLVERALIRTEAELLRYPAPDPSETEPSLASLKRERYTNDAAYRKALADYGIGEEELRAYLLEQLTVMSFVDYRFGPAVQLQEDDLRTYYKDRFVPEWQNKNRGSAPEFDEVRDQISDALRGERVNRLLDEWLKDAKSRTRIEYKPEAFQ